MADPATPAPVDRLPERMLGALLAVADARHELCFVALHQPPLAVLALPERRAGVAVLDRGDCDEEELRARLHRLLQSQGQGVLYVILVGGSAADRQTLQIADREAPDPNHLGAYHLDVDGRLRHVAGRRLALVATAAEQARRTEPIHAEAIAARNERARREHDESVDFGATLSHRPQHATRFLGAACIIYFALSVYWSPVTDWSNIDPNVLINMGANEVARGEPWRLLSYAFLHAGWLHLASNLIALFSFGGFLEGVLGWRRYVLLYTLSAAVGGIASATLGPGFSVGASGAIWGLMTAGAALMSPKRRLLPPAVAARLRPRLLQVLLLNSAISVMPLFVASFPRIDLYAHAGGGLAGFLLAITGVLTAGLPGWEATRVEPPGAYDARPLRFGAALTVLALVLSVGLALRKGHPWRQPPAIPKSSASVSVSPWSTVARRD